MRQIRFPNLFAALITKLDVMIHWGADITSRIDFPGWRRMMIMRYGIGALQREGAMFGIRAMDTRCGCGASSGHAHGDGHGEGFLGGDGAVGADLAGGDAEFALAEDVAGEDVCDAEDDDDDARGDDDAPVGGAEGFLGGGFFVEVAEDGDADDGHEDS